MSTGRREIETLHGAGTTGGAFHEVNEGDRARVQCLDEVTENALRVAVMDAVDVADRG